MSLKNDHLSSVITPSSNMQTLTLVYNIQVTEVLYARVCNTKDGVQMSVKLKSSENAVKPQTGIEYTKVIIDL